MNSFRRLVSSTFSKTAGITRPPMRSVITSKLVPAATGAAAFGMGCMMVSPDLRSRTLLSGKTAGLVPLSLGANTSSKDGRAAGSVEHETGLHFSAYGAQLAELFAQEDDEFRELSERQSKNPSPDLEREVHRRLLRLRSLYNAFWALHMIDVANYPEVYQLLEDSAEWLSLTVMEALPIFAQAQGAIISGETETLKNYISHLYEEHHRRGLIQFLPTPVSELELFMMQSPTGSAVLNMLRLLHQIAAQNTEASRLILEDTLYKLWWTLEQNLRQFARQ